MRQRTMLFNAKDILLICSIMNYKLSGLKWSRKWDLGASYYQLKLNSDPRYTTTFATH